MFDFATPTVKFVEQSFRRQINANDFIVSVAMGNYLRFLFIVLHFSTGGETE